VAALNRAYHGYVLPPGVRRQALAGLVAQTSQGAMGVGIILVVRGHTGSLALAGAVVGALSIAAGVSRPVQGRLIDTRGSPAVMAICGVAHPAALIAIVAVAPAHALEALLIALGIVAGITLPPVSTSMRAEWGAVVGENDRTAAYSLVYLVQELAILAGPLLLSVVIAAATASAALTAVAVLTAAGTLAFAASLRAAPSHRTAHEQRGGVLKSAGMRMVLLISLWLGAVIGAIEVAAPTFATAHHAPAAAGLLIAAVSVGGIAGAAIYGSHRWRPDPQARLLILLAALTACLAIAIAAGTLLLLAALLLLAGVALNPCLTTLSLLVDRHVVAASAAEAFGWMSTAIAGGTGAASAIAAVITQHHSPRAALIAAAAAGVTATGLTAAATRKLRASRGD
jgi:predicted MFS family arabinose efflux permease